MATLCERRPHDRLLRHRRLEPRRPDAGPARRLEYSRRRRRGAEARPRTRFYDNLDATTLAGALATLDLAATRFVVISKSGGTPETLVQALAALAAVHDAGLAARIPELFLGVTEPAAAGGATACARSAHAHGIPVLDHHAGIGGRFSVLTNVGLLPAMARGLDARAVRAGRQGRRRCAGRCRTSPPAFAPAVGAAVAVGLARERGIRAQVMMPYADRLQRFGHWFAQLWAESLGKGGQGTTPIACLGPLDQHSQLQLFMDGAARALRDDRAAADGRHRPDAAGGSGRGGRPRLHGRPDRRRSRRGAGRGRAGGAGQAGRPVRTFDLPRLDEATLGALMMHMMLETILAARLLGVDPFDQPAVELAKVLTRERLALNV